MLGSETQGVMRKRESVGDLEWAVMERAKEEEARRQGALGVKSGIGLVIGAGIGFVLGPMLGTGAVLGLIFGAGVGLGAGAGLARGSQQ